MSLRHLGSDSLRKRFVMEIKMSKILKDQFERRLCACAVVALICLFAVKIKFNATDYMKTEWPNVVLFFQAKAFEDIVGDLLTGLIAAYFFYVVIDVIPRMRKDLQNMEVLNRLVASIVDSYTNIHFFGHTMAITQVDLGLLKSDVIEKMIDEVRLSPNFIKLKCALFTAHSRHADFSATLNIASSISSERALQWLVLTDKVRLLVDNYEQDPISADYEPRHVFGSARSDVDQDAVDFLEYELALNGYLGSLQQGVLEYLEQVRYWISPLPESDPANGPTNIENHVDSQH